MLGAASIKTFYSGTSEDYGTRVRQQIENRLLNAQARIEYELLKTRVISGVAEANKFFEQDDQILIQEYQLCLSLSYHKRIFVMEFRQVPGHNDQCNHSLDLIFRVSPTKFNKGGRSTLILSKGNSQFVWQQLHPLVGGPEGSTRMLGALIMRWLQDEKNLYLRLAPV